MTTATAEWSEVTRAAPCPLCSKGDWCGRSGDAIRCMRVADAPAGWERIKAHLDGGTTFKPADFGNPKLNGSAKRGRIVKTYPYVDEHGELLYEVVRFEPKDFRQRRPDGNGGWTWSLKGVPRVLYRLPDLIRAGDETFVFVVEGEKDVDRLVAEGLVATTCPQGAGKWHHVDDEPLRDRHVVLLPDRDQQGQRHAQDVAHRLSGKAATVRVLELPDLPNKGDASDWLDAGGDGEALVRMAEAAPEWEPEPDDIAADDKAGAVVVRLDTVQTRPVDWLYPGKMARGKLTLIAGDGGLGKSFLMLAWASAISTGNGFVDCTTPREPGGVVLLSAEDDVADTIVPRLNAAGANLSRIVAIEGVRALDDEGNRTERVVDLSTDLRHVEHALGQVENPTAIIIDPISAYYPRIDSHNNSEVRSSLAQLAAMAERWRVAVVLVTHLNKGSNRSAIHRIQGSVAYGAACRMVWGVVKDKDDPDRRLLLPVKNNLAQDRHGLAYKLRDAGTGTPQVHWEADMVDMSADDAMSDDEDGGRTATEEACDWLRELLSSGPVPASEVMEQAVDAGLAESTVRTAKRRIKAKSVQKREGDKVVGWFWQLKPT